MTQPPEDALTALINAKLIDRMKYLIYRLFYETPDGKELLKLLIYDAALAESPAIDNPRDFFKGDYFAWEAGRRHVIKGFNDVITIINLMIGVLQNGGSIEAARTAVQQWGSKGKVTGG